MDKENYQALFLSQFSDFSFQAILIPMEYLKALNQKNFTLEEKQQIAVV